MNNTATEASVKTGIGIFGSTIAHMSANELVSFVAAALTIMYVLIQILVISPKIPGAIRYWIKRYRERNK